MDFLAEISTAWSEGWGATVATILAVMALLKSMGKEIRQLSTIVWRWKGWATISRLYRKAIALYRVRRAKSLMRQGLEGDRLRIRIRVYENCLRGDPSDSKRDQLEAITPAKPSWLNDYYVATALKSLIDEGKAVKATRYSVKSWPPDPEAYDFSTVNDDGSSSDEAVRVETNDKCVAYQSFGYCPRPGRFEPKHIAETISPRETRFETTFPLKDMAPPCELCWEKESRERDLRILVDNITKYDLADVASLEITGTNGELQEIIAKICIESQCEAEVGLVKPMIKQAIDVRKRQIARCASRSQCEWRQGENEELVATLEKYINSQTAQ